jgi:hypothetical protein
LLDSGEIGDGVDADPISAGRIRRDETGFTSFVS